jgi:cysteinyl-tRNA synthetase
MEAISGKKPLVKYWMHTGFLTINGQKMSKSLGNFITIGDFLNRYSVQQLRFLILKNLWHSPFDYSESVMLEVRSGMGKIEEFLRKIKNTETKKSTDKNLKKSLEKFKVNFYKELDDDFNTPKAFAVMFDFIKETNKFLEKDLISNQQAKEIYKFFEIINQIFGIIDFKKTKKITMPSDVKKLIAIREKYRNQQNWQKADETRIEIEKKGYSVEDTKAGQIIKSIE